MEGIKEKQEALWFDIANALGRIYTECYYCDAKKDTYRFFRRSTEKTLTDEGNYTNAILQCTELMVSDEDKKKILKRLDIEYVRKHLSYEKDMYHIDYKLKNASDDEWSEITVLYVDSDENGDLRHFVVAFQNINERKRHEKETKEAIKTAITIAKQADTIKQDFLSYMSDKMLNPINNIIGMAGMALANLDDIGRTVDCLKVIENSGKNLLELVSEVLDMSNIDKGKLTLSEDNISIPDIVDGVVEFVQNKIKAKGHEFTVRAHDIQHEYIIGDMLHIQKVILNVLGNAIKYTPSHGRISMEITEKKSEQKRIGCYEVIICDNGIGVKEEYLQKIFEPFERLKTGKLKNIEGTGLGLSIANSIVKLMGGDIKVESKVGKGSKFTITFMAYFQEKEEKLLANSADLSVLIVDSDVYSRAEEMNILQKMDVDCKCEVNGLEAIETLIKAKGCGKQYSAVIIDWDIEGMSAADTIKNIYDIAGNSLPVFVTTLGKSQYIKKDFCDKLECSFILKPLFASKILKAFNKVMPDLFEVQSVNDIAEQKYNGKNIILAGKDSSNLELFRILGINTDVVETEKELLELFESNKKYYYDAIIVDMQIEQMNGYAVACAIRSFEREDAGEIPIIAKVPNIFSVDVYAGLSSGISAYANENSEDIEMLNILDKWLCGTYAEKKLIAEKNEEIQEHIRKLEFQASHDSFTGVLNKTAIFKQADDIIKEKEDAVHGMLVLDIDGFKNINDLYGHSEGDKVIYELAQILQDMFRESDIVGRFGGDEFVVFMKDIKSVDMSEKKAEVLIKTVREHFAGRFGEIDLTISVGVVNSRIGYNSVRMFEKADKALYYAKENGKNCYYVYDSIAE